MAKIKVIIILVVVLAACAVLFSVVNQPEEPHQPEKIESEGYAHAIFNNRYGSDTANELLATIGNVLEDIAVAELIQKYDGQGVGPEERKELETLLAQTDNDNIKKIIRFILQTNDVTVASRTGVYRDMPDVSTVTIEPLMTPIYSRFDGYIKATRTGGDLSEPLFIYLTLSGAEGIHNSVFIPAGESEGVLHDTMYDIEGDTVTYEITKCKQRSPECDYANYSSAHCTPLTVPCHIGDPRTATFQIASREEEPTVTIKPIKATVSDPSEVAFEITRTGDISKYLSILRDCRSSNSFNPEPLGQRTLIPAGTRTMVYPSPVGYDAASITCYVGVADGATDQATVSIVSEQQRIVKVQMNPESWGYYSEHTSSTEGGTDSAVTFSVRRGSGGTDKPLTVQVQCEETGDFIAGNLPTSVTIPAGERWGDVLLPIEDDEQDEPDGTVTCKVLPNEAYIIQAEEEEEGSWYTSEASYLIHDDD